MRHCLAINPNNKMIILYITTMKDMVYKKIIEAIFIGLCVGIFCGSAYGWLNITSNADNLRGISGGTSDWADVRMGFEKTKAALLGLAIGAFSAIISYFALSTEEEKE